MNYDNVTAVGGEAGRTGGTHTGRENVRNTIERGASITGRLATYLVVALAAVWVVFVAATAFGGLLAATVIGLGVLYALPWIVITGAVRVLDALE